MVQVIVHAPEDAARYVTLGPNGERDTSLMTPEYAAERAAALGDGWQVIPEAEAPPEEAPPPPPPVRILSALEFRRRFTAEERGAITAAAAAALRATPPDPTLQVFMDDLAAANEVDLDHADVAAGLDALVAAELLTAERRAEIVA